MRTAIVFLALLAVSFASLDAERTFQNWRVQNHKFYSSGEEYQKRYAIFSENMQRVSSFNAEKHSFEVGLNYFADLSTPEFVALYTAYMPEQDSKDTLVHVVSDVAADSVDWRNQGYVNAVKDQGQCGSCYAFGGVCAAEGAYAMNGHPLTSFSEQEVVDCSSSQGNQGCNGGWHYSTMDYIIANGGICTEDSYPYTAKKNSCNNKSCTKISKPISSRTTVTAKDENALKSAVSGHVVAIAIDASKWSFQMYKSGIYDEATCSSTSLDHAVTAIGFGTDGGKDFWLVRNSWGQGWGEAGYIRMSRNKNNQCGVATKAYYAN